MLCKIVEKIAECLSSFNFIINHKTPGEFIEKQKESLQIIYDNLSMFHHYLGTHQLVLKKVEEYNPNDGNLAASPIHKNKISRSILRLHPHPVKELTPVQPSPGAVRFNEEQRIDTKRSKPDSTTATTPVLFSSPATAATQQFQSLVVDAPAAAAAASSRKKLHYSPT